MENQKTELRRLIVWGNQTNFEILTSPARDDLSMNEGKGVWENSDSKRQSERVLEEKDIKPTKEL